MEVDADNVALALQYYIGNANNQDNKSYLGIVLSSENEKKRNDDDKLLANIRAFNTRRERGTYTNAKGIFRLSRIVNTQKSTNENK